MQYSNLSLSMLSHLRLVKKVKLSLTDVHRKAKQPLYAVDKA